MALIRHPRHDQEWYNTMVASDAVLLLVELMRSTGSSGHQGATEHRDRAPGARALRPHVTLLDPRVRPRLRPRLAPGGPRSRLCSAGLETMAGMVRWGGGVLVWGFSRGMPTGAAMGLRYMCAIATGLKGTISS